jgi:hypothetical protein
MGARFRLDQLPEHVQAQVSKQLYGNPSPDNPASSPVVERTLSDGPLAAPKAKEGDTAKYLVRIKSYRVRLLDEDNLCGKWFVDALRYASILPSDTPDKAHIEICQEKVAHKVDQRTEITISYPWHSS